MRLFILLTLLVSSLLAQELLRFKAAWQMMGPTQNMKVDSFFNRNEVLQVWAYDAQAQKWLGYSPDANISDKIAQRAETLESIKAYQAVWVLSDTSWTAEPLKSDVVENNQSDTIHLYEGWNLVALPSKTSLSVAIFGDDVTIWKKPYQGPWEFQGEGESGFKKISRITTSEALWVKSKREQRIDIPKASAELETFKSKKQMLDYLHELTVYKPTNYYGCLGGIEFRNPNLIYALEDAVPTEVATDIGNSDKSASDATETNLQESDVDESDSLKHNGNEIFFYDQNSNEIRVSSFSKIVNQDKSIISTIGLNIKDYFQGMYIYQDSLVVLQTTYLSNYAQTAVSFYDINDTSDIQLIDKYTLDGRLNNSRISSGKLHLITQFSPRIEYNYPLIETDGKCPDYYYLNSETVDPVVVSESTPSVEAVNVAAVRSASFYCYSIIENGKKYRYDYRHPSVKSEYLIPQIIHDKRSSALITYDNVYASLKLDQSAQITTVSDFDLDTHNFKESLSYIGNAQTLYSSSSALYISSIDYGRYYNFYTQAQELTLYKIAIKDGLQYLGREKIKGHLLNQFSMSEHNSTLRVATTDRRWWRDSSVKNQVYTIGQSEDNNFTTLGELYGIGHEGEAIRAVRFIGERGFIVTFRQTDPFYTLDLSDVSAPHVAGELKINGFSEYFHPIDENRIMSIGRNADEQGVTGGLQLELFDITDFTHPILADKFLIGDRNTYSSLEYDHKALAFRSSDKLFSFPYRTYNYTSPSSRSLGVYKVDGFTLSPIDTISFDDSSYGQARSIIFSYNNQTYSALYANGVLKAQIIKDK